MSQLDDNSFWKKVRRHAARLGFVEDLVAAWYCLKDERTPVWARAWLIGALVYFVVPLDAIPDIAVPLGYADDAAVLSTALGIVRAHLRAEHYDRAREALGL